MKIYLPCETPLPQVLVYPTCTANLPAMLRDKVRGTRMQPIQLDHITDSHEKFFFSQREVLSFSRTHSNYPVLTIVLNSR